MSAAETASNDTSSHLSYDPNATIVELFFAQVQRTPEKIALIQDDQSVTYSELAQRVVTTAQSLQNAGVCRGDHVCLFAGRSLHTVAAQLGSAVLGAVFVPLDPGAPALVNRTIMNEAKPKAILCQAENANVARHLARDLRTIVLPETVSRSCHADLSDLLFDPENQIGPDDPAYIIYTSGSTGRPKGVMIAHRGVCRLVRGQTYADLGPEQVMLNMAAVGFDANIGEIYSAVLNGGTLAILPDAAPSLDRIAEVIARDRVTIAYITVGLFHIIAENCPQILAPLQQVFPCGDVLSETHVRTVQRALPHLRMINGYGPTENTVFTCCYAVNEDWRGGPIPIGVGLKHDHLFVLDEDLNPLSDGSIGQLAVGGAGIALGYLGRPDLTSASFVMLRTPEFNGRVYLTGDLVTRRADGVVCFHGRLDRQIKINGQRVELDMVEHTLRADPSVRDAVAIAAARPDGNRQIVAFVIPKQAVEPKAATTMLERLRANLPAAAVPSRVELRDSFPLSASGKVDRKRIAAEFGRRDEALGAKPKPTTLRDTIRRTWEDVLGTDVPDTNRTFFDMGGTSLQLMAMHTRLQQRLGRAFDIALLFEAPRIRDLERLLEKDSPKPFVKADMPDPIAARRAAMAQARLQRKTAS